METKTIEKFKALTNCFVETNPRIIEGLKDVLAGVYVDHMRRENKKNPEGLGYEVYEALNAYLQKELCGVTVLKRVTDMEQLVMRREMEGYHNHKATALEELFSDNGMNIPVFDRVINSTAQNVAQKLNSETFSKVAKLVVEEPLEFKEYLSNLARTQEINVGEHWFGSIESQLRAYGELLHFMMQTRKQ